MQYSSLFQIDMSSHDNACMQEEDKRLVIALQARALIDDVGMDNVTIHLDTYHMNIEENSMEAAVKDAEDKLGWEPAH